MFWVALLGMRDATEVLKVRSGATVVFTATTGKDALNSETPLPNPRNDNEVLVSMLVFSVVSGGATTLIVALTEGAVVLIKLVSVVDSDGIVTAASAVGNVVDTASRLKTPAASHLQSLRLLS